MKKIIIAILSLISLNAYSFEVGSITYDFGRMTGDIGFGTRMALGSAGPSYIWRQYGEDANFRILDVPLMEYGSDRGNTVQRDLRFRGNPLEVTAPSGMEISVFNERIEQVVGPPMEFLAVWRSDNRFDSQAILGETSGKEMQIARISSDLEVMVPWNISDGTYSLKTRFNGILDIYIYGTNSYYADVRNQNRTSTDVNFDVITYLEVSVRGDTDFGKIIFTAGANEITRRGDISILGGQNTSIKIKTLEPKIFLKRVGQDDTVPVFIKLMDGHNVGEEIDVRLDNSGRKNLSYEVKIEPGLYPDIPEGKYTGTARFEIKYN